MQVPKSLVYSSIPVFFITSIVWLAALSKHTFHAREFWIYVGIYAIPAAFVCGSIWILWATPIWRRIAGSVLLIPSLGVWLLSLLLVSVGFKIH